MPPATVPYLPMIQRFTLSESAVKGWRTYKYKHTSQSQMCSLHLISLADFITWAQNNNEDCDIALVGVRGAGKMKYGNLELVLMPYFRRASYDAPLQQLLQAKLEARARERGI